eukprot:CAMPEP_0171086674 /NCGR_PEP_ID=MMETSP0766_2-20121228/19690_1 /TAXON_ID=439317 /ORGANISM="Gambierdiscus australes, Strain CAWD 149" /LENGTH=73 /DNA_ID=CAMNT_0011544337 /DNA_START=31 /DNA_END=249 /DNA_ORIENTATION=+
MAKRSDSPIPCSSVSPQSGAVGSAHRQPPPLSSTSRHFADARPPPSTGRLRAWGTTTANCKSTAAAALPAARH